ncbi:MAG: radical SAM family heme chaperone HemW [Burkholderiales bacterium]|nr:radical SAM family heme chaperone HemW [Burkholderiales bacterium]
MATAVIQAPAPASGTRLAVLPPLAVYVHLPWCVRKCPYCDFNSHEARGALPEDEYVDALIADLESALPAVWGRRVHTVFLGGGTPSLFAARSIDRLLAAIRARLALDPDAEVTLEANPGTVEAGRFRDFRAAGVNRLSLGVQSFDDGCLASLGRIHGAREAHRAVEIAAQSFANFNIDLMYALPGQDEAGARRDAQAAIASGAPHVSAYHLTIEPNTLFATRPPPLPDEDAAAAIHDAVEATLAAAGFRHYETSAHARAGHECRHNLNYWRFGDYLGIGAGAHAKISFPDRVVREARARTPAEYMRRVAAGAQVVERREVARGELAFEFMMNAFRLTEGFAPALFTERTGLAIAAVAAPLARAEAKGLAVVGPTLVRPTERGRRYLNDLLELFLDSGPEGSR